MLKLFKREFWFPDMPSLPENGCTVLMAEIVDDFTSLAFQSLRYEVHFDPGNVSPDGRHYNFGPGEGRASGWRPLSRKFGEYGFYIVETLDRASAISEHS